ncbi:hypothetical protein [Ligilactobacillus murinus]|uniref:hypothetical protein n=1 Tax=Ligilactobacillus murinus TaxID=1622 RepID=UPI0012984593|nr:hypothetical protein [Ligilactobacillus murinus]
MGGLGIATAPAWITIGAGVAIAAWGASWAIKETGVGKFVKNKWNDFLKKGMILEKSKG